MGLIFKQTLKSLTSHKMRTLLLLFCITVCSLTALIASDMGDSAEYILHTEFSQLAGKTDITMVSDAPLDISEIGADFPESDVLEVFSLSQEFYHRLDGSYNYVHKENVLLTSMDIQKAAKMKMIPDDIVLGEKEIAVPAKFAKEFGYKEGDDIILHSELKEPVTFKVAYVSANSGLFISNRLFINEDDLKTLDKDGVLEANLFFIDVFDDGEADRAEQMLKEKFPAAEVENMMGSSEMREAVQSISRIFWALFAICFLVVIFVTFSISERVLTEKMSVIGTFRSLGISQNMTAFALLLENIVFGLAGGIIGSVIYSRIKYDFFSSLFTVADTEGNTLPLPDLEPASFSSCAAVTAAILIECLCPVKEILKAVKIPIRDIILDNKDTEFRPSRAADITGIVLLITAAVTYFIKGGFITDMICFFSVAAALALLFNHILRAAAKGIAHIGEKADMPILTLAAVQTGARKSTVGASVLCVTAAAISIMIFILSESLAGFFGYDPYTGDVIVNTDYSTKSEFYDYFKDIDSVTDTETLYISNDTADINGGKDFIASVYGCDSAYKMYDNFVPVMNGVGYDEVILDRQLVNKNGLKVGDNVDISFKKDYILSETRTLKLVGICEVNRYDSSGTTVIISEKYYRELYKDMPYAVVLETSEPEKVRDFIKAHSAVNTTSVKTRTEYDAELAADTAQTKAITGALIVLSAGLTFIGVVSNLLIGFEGRKRECAVMYSTSMPKSALTKMLILESFISAGISLIAAVPVSLILISVFMRMTSELMLVIPLEFSFGKCLTVTLLLWAVFTLTSFFPVRALKKTDIASQLKYE